MTPRFVPRRSSVSAPLRRRVSRSWIIAIALLGGLCLAAGAFFTSTTGKHVLSTLRFAFGWYDIPAQQRQLQYVLKDILRQTGLDEQAYQRDHLQSQQRGRERWRLWRHRIAIPADLSLTAFEKRLRERMPDLPHDIMARRSRELDRQLSVAFTLGVANVPTDICIFTQIPSSPSVAAVVPKPEPLAPRAVLKRAPVTNASPQIAIVIDDMGWELPIAQDLLALDHPLSFAVLPQAPYQSKIAEAARQHKRELLLHLPMEPHGYPKVNPGPNALLGNMDSNQIVKLVRRALRSLPQVVGVNNHMGSSLTENPQVMRIVMRELKRRDLFFLDSRTSADSRAYQIARDMGIPTAKRHVFLDNNVQQAHISAQLHQLAQMASEQGHAIGIGHPYPETLHALKHTLPIILQAGVRIVPISRLVN
ncbi:divergent polysaccharide deacetylase family protein [Candidatus Entotheonella palauensis]|uniref:divergent polysaccharide deacetylase family protein n=1 Tax=Candidatus Entotheonella palauensis TaxID=93172 RepID=UPI0004B68F1A|nr:divergent polysaccharide deacetylase family protein [Candidatus Entotheonella palauensis]